MISQFIYRRDPKVKQRRSELCARPAVLNSSCLAFIDDDHHLNRAREIVVRGVQASVDIEECAHGIG
jgi:hypothetical protein